MMSVITGVEELDEEVADFRRFAHRTLRLEKLRELVELDHEVAQVVREEQRAAQSALEAK